MSNISRQFSSRWWLYTSLTGLLVLITSAILTATLEDRGRDAELGDPSVLEKPRSASVANAVSPRRVDPPRAPQEWYDSDTADRLATLRDLADSAPALETLATQYPETALELAGWAASLIGAREDDAFDEGVLACRGRHFQQIDALCMGRLHVVVGSDDGHAGTVIYTRLVYAPGMTDACNAYMACVAEVWRGRAAPFPEQLGSGDSYAFREGVHVVFEGALRDQSELIKMYQDEIDSLKRAIARYEKRGDLTFSEKFQLAQSIAFTKDYELMLEFHAGR